MRRGRQRFLSCSFSAMRGHSEKTAVTYLQTSKSTLTRNQALPETLSLTSLPQNCEKTNFSCLSYPVYSIFFMAAEQTNTFNL